MPSAIPVPSVPDRLTRLPLSRPDLRLLDAIGQCGDLAEAARRAGLRAAAAERRLDRLDQATGLRLTLRDARTARLSTEGARVLVAGRRFFRQVDQAVQTEIYGRGTEALNAPRILDIATAEPLMEDLVEDAADTLGILLSVSHDTPCRCSDSSTATGWTPRTRGVWTSSRTRSTARSAPTTSSTTRSG